MTILLYAIANQRVEIIKYLLDEGYDVNFKNEFCENPLIYAVHYNYGTTIDLILKYKPDLEIRSSKLRTTALETAIYRNKPNTVEKLIKSGAKFSLESYRKSCNNLTHLIFYFSWW
jgi:ankyrin repeat protein